MKCTCASVHIHDCVQNLKFWWQGRKFQPLASVLYDPSPNITKLFVLCIRFNRDLLPTYTEWVTEIGENLRHVCCVSIFAFSFRTLTVNMDTNWGLIRIGAVFRSVSTSEASRWIFRTILFDAAISEVALNVSHVLYLNVGRFFNCSVSHNPDECRM